MLENVKDGFVKEVLLSPTIDKFNLADVLRKVGGLCSKDLENGEIPFEVVEKRKDFWFAASDSYRQGDYPKCREHLINYFSV